RLLPPMSEESSATTHKYLHEMGIIIKLNTLVESYDGEVAILKGGEQIKTQTLIWAAGVTGALIKGLPEESLERGRNQVNEYNQMLGYPDIFAIGDIAMMKTPEYP